VAAIRVLDRRLVVPFMPLRNGMSRLFRNSLRLTRGALDRVK
jgi:hypothetical protein